MIWPFTKFYGSFDRDLPGEFVTLLDRNFATIQRRSQYINLIHKRFVDASAAAQTIYLTDGTVTEQDQFIIKTDSSGNAVTVIPYGTQTINGAASLTLAAQYNKVLLTFYNGTWYIVST